MIFIWCTIVLVIQLLVIWVWKIWPSNKKEQAASIAGVSVVIAFHNEEERIKPLISALNKVVLSPNIELIFVDDHSTDQTVKTIKENLTIPHKIIGNNDQKGKKFAIRFAANQCKHDYFLTLDADVSMPEDYFDRLLELAPADLMILPVEMTGDNFAQRMASIEFYFLQFLGQSSGKMNHPVIAYGANLCVNKKAFFELDTVRTDYHIVSGDDMFLLETMKREKRDIYIDLESVRAVETPAPANFFAVLQQRRRWLSKMGGLIDWQTGFALLLLIGVQVAMICAIVMSFYQPIFLSLVGLKFFSELIITQKLWRKDPLNMVVLLLHQVYYPIFLLVTFVPVRKEKKWERN